MPIGFSKEQQLAHHIKRKASKQSSKAIGNAGEEKAIDSFCELLGRERTPQDRRNNQAKIYGGISNPDINIKGLEGWHHEVKDDKDPTPLKWWDTLVSETPQFKRPGLNFFYKGEELVIHRKKDLMNLAQDLCEAAEMDVVPRH